jgi:hypothetical protein
VFYPTEVKSKLESRCKAGFSLGEFFFRANEQKVKVHDWVAMSSAFVASQSSSFFPCSREQKFA